MDTKLGTMKVQFNQQLAHMLVFKGQNTQVFTKSAYLKMIKIIKDTKRRGIRSPTDIQRLFRFDVLKINNEDKLYAPAKENCPMRYYVYTDEIYKILHDTHVELNHGGQGQMERKIAVKYKNITRDMIALFLSLCKLCETRNTSPKKAFIKKELTSRCRIDILKMRPVLPYNYLLVYQDYLTKFVMLKTLKTTSLKEISEALVDIFGVLGAPNILESKYSEKIIQYIRERWPRLVIASGKPTAPDKCLIEIQTSLYVWEEKRANTAWVDWIPFVQLIHNRTHRYNMCCSPSEAMFGCQLRIGLRNCIPEADVMKIKTEDELEDYFRMNDPLYHLVDRVPPANPPQQQQTQPPQLTPQVSPQSQPQPSPPPTVNQKKSSLPPLAPKPPGSKLPQPGSSSSSASVKQLPKLLPKPQNNPPEVCLRWNSYHSNMQNTFPSLLNNEQFVDVTLACDGRSIKCHKVMLSACSPYMEELLSSNPCQHPIIFLKDMKFWQLQALIDFMYRGEVNVTQDKLPSLLSAAEALQIKGLASPVNHSAPPKITQVQPLSTPQHDLSDDMDQVTYLRHLQLQTDIKSEYEDEYMQDTDESPPPTPKAKKRKTSSMHSTSGTSNGSIPRETTTASQTKPNILNKPKREKEKHLEPSTSHQVSTQAPPILQTDKEQVWNVDNDKTADSETDFKNVLDDHRNSGTHDEDLDLDEKSAQIILERYSSQNDDYSRGGDGDVDMDTEMDDNSTTSG